MNYKPVAADTLPLLRGERRSHSERAGRRGQEQQRSRRRCLQQLPSHRPPGWAFAEGGLTRLGGTDGYITSWQGNHLLLHPSGAGRSPALGSSPGCGGTREGVSATAGLCPPGLGALTPCPPTRPGGRERLVSERCEEQEGRRKSSNTKQVSGEPKLCCFLPIMKYS